jgi:hypothetical protein
MYTMYLFFFVSVNRYQRRVLAVRVTEEESSVTRLLSPRRCYLT